MNYYIGKYPSEFDIIQFYERDVRSIVEEIFTSSSHHPIFFAKKSTSYDNRLNMILEHFIENSKFQVRDKSLIFAIYCLVEIDLFYFWSILEQVLFEFQSDYQHILKEVLVLVIKYCSKKQLCFQICVKYHLSCEILVDLYCVVITCVDKRTHDEWFSFIWEDIEWTAVCYQLPKQWLVDLDTACHKQDKKRITELLKCCSK